MDIDYRGYPILVVDDEPDILRSFQINYGDDFTILTASNGTAGLGLLRDHDAGVIVADQRMPGMSGAEFLEHALGVRPDAVRIILTGYADHEALIRAVNTGRVYRYVAKPWESEDLRDTLQGAIERFHLGRENSRLVAELQRANARLAVENEYLKETAAADTSLIGNGPALMKIKDMIARVAPNKTTVLIVGESGTGKELVARAIHEASPRRNKLYVCRNLANIPETLMESELFGHRKGAFSGATEHRKGLFEVADGGTFFLDEITEIALPLQVKLLRVLQEGEIYPLGQNEPRKVDVRILAATNRNLEQCVKEGKLREDLYFRLRVFPITVPPLRDRREDIPALVLHFVERISHQLKRRPVAVSDEALALLQRYRFPGNVRELEHAIERALVLADPGEPLTEDLFLDQPMQEAVAGDGGALQSQTADFERAKIEEALARVDGVKAHAARELGMTYRGLLKKMQRLGMM